jgi:hypothetical protein
MESETSEWEEDELETPKAGGVSRKSPLDSSNLVSIADIRRKVATKFRQADQIMTRQIKPQKRQRNCLDMEHRSTESDTCMSDMDDEEPLPSIKSLFDSTEAELDRPGRRGSNIRPKPSPERQQVSVEHSNDRREIYVDCHDRPLMFSVKPSTTGGRIMEAVARSMGVPDGSIRLTLSISRARLCWDQRYIKWH